MKLPTILFRNTGVLDAHGNPVREPVELNDFQSMQAAMSLDALNNAPGGLSQARLNANGATNDTSMGFQIALDTATYYRKQITEQTFYTVKEGLDAFVPMSVGEGAWSESMLTNRSFSEGGAFSDGIITDGGQSAKLSTVTASMAAITLPVYTWAKKKTWSIPQVQKALRNNNWDFIYHLEMARKTNFDLGCQEITFLGLQNDTTNCPGLLNNPSSTIDTSTITVPISQMSAAQLATFVSTVIGLYAANTTNWALPDTFVIPLSDYLGMPAFAPNVIGAGTGTFPVSIGEYIERAFRMATQNPAFKVMGVAYANPAVNNTLRGLNKNIYMLYRRDLSSLYMAHPVPYTGTQANTTDNFVFQDVGYAQFTGVQALRPLELYQMQF